MFDAICWLKSQAFRLGFKNVKQIFTTINKSPLLALSSALILSLSTEIGFSFIEWKWKLLHNPVWFCCSRSPCSETYWKRRKSRRLEWKSSQTVLSSLRNPSCFQVNWKVAGIKLVKNQILLLAHFCWMWYFMWFMYINISSFIMHNWRTFNLVAVPQNVIFKLTHFSFGCRKIIMRHAHSSWLQSYKQNLE